LIIDANVLSLTLEQRKPNDFTPIWKALISGNAVAVYGGKLAREYAELRKFVPLIKELDRQGKFRQMSAQDVDAETLRVESQQCCRSDDPHVIALARVAKVRLLCSRDADLQADFGSKSVLNPPGSVYQRPEHEPLIRAHCGGGGGKSKRPKRKRRAKRRGSRK
jgi:hypothetical protein